MELILNHTRYHVSLDTVEEFEQTILSDPFVKPANQTNKFISKSSFLIWRFWGKINSYLKLKRKFKVSTPSKNSKQILGVLMKPDFSQCLPYFLFPAGKSLFMFDAWPQSHDRIINFVNFFKVNNLFLSSSQVTEILQSKIKGTKCFWIPEGIRPELYKHYPLKDKDIDVLALGRKYDAYHDLIVDLLQKSEKTYLYEKEKGKIIFPGRAEFIDGLARSKISVCFPSSITHPERSGNIETMTIRYLQSMISKCLVIGHAPNEMITLFGYNPIVEIDMKDPVNQLQLILTNYSDYIPLIEKNYNVVLKDHTWQNRWNKIKGILGDTL